MRRAATEHEIQAAIVDALRLAGFTVRETTAYRQKGPSGVDKGIADLLVFHEILGPVLVGSCLCLEVKRPGNWKFSSHEQGEAWSNREFEVVHNPIAALYAANQWLEGNVDAVLGRSSAWRQYFEPAQKRVVDTMNALKKAGA